MLNIKNHITGLQNSFQQLYTGKSQQINFNADTTARLIPTSKPDVFSVHLIFYVSTKERYNNGK